MARSFFKNYLNKINTHNPIQETIMQMHAAKPMNESKSHRYTSSLYRQSMNELQLCIRWSLPG